MTWEEIKNKQICVEFYKLKNECEKVCSPYGLSRDELHRISDSRTVVGRVENFLDMHKIEVICRAQDSWDLQQAEKDILAFAVSRLSRVTSENVPDRTSRKRSPRVDNWLKEKAKNLRSWANRYFGRKGKIVMRWHASRDGHTESFLSVDQYGILHLHIATEYPDYDIPEDGVDEITGLMEKMHAEVNEITNARHEYWRKEERDGKL